MRRFLVFGSVLLTVLLVTDGSLLAQRGQGRGRGGQPTPQAGRPAERPTRPTQPTAQGRRGNAGRPEGQARGATDALRRNPRLAARVQELLPGQDVEAAALGFRNQGQFLAAVHASENLGVPFEDVKTRMVDDELSLGEAIADLDPDVDARAAVRRAEAEAEDDLEQLDD